MTPVSILDFQTVGFIGNHIPVGGELRKSSETIKIYF